MKFLASPRIRRRLAWLGVAAVFAAAIGGLALLLPDRHQAAEPLTAGGVAPPKAEHSVKRGKKSLAEPLSVAEKFLNTAVARRHVGDSWELIDPTFPGKEEYTRATWAKGDIPVVPFPVADAKYRIDYSYRNELGLRVALFAPKGNKTRAAVFDIELRRSRQGGDRRWLIDSFMPAGGADAASFGVPRGNTGLPNLDPNVRGSGKSRLGKGWLLLPLSVFLLALMTPIGIGILNAVRGRRAEREFARGA
jgi:hypothetical protein